MMKECKICSQITAKICDQKTSQTYYRCQNCGFVFLDDSMIITSESEHKHYSKHNNTFECRGYVEMFEKFIEEFVKPLKSKIKTALDFGCGEGKVLAKLLEMEGFKTDYYDLYFFSEKVYETKKYDLITSTEVFEHLKDPLEYFKLLKQHLNKNGYLIIMTKFPPKCDEEFLKWWYRRDITHISFFTPNSFDTLAQIVGYKIIKTNNSDVVVLQNCD